MTRISRLAAALLFAVSAQAAVDPPIPGIPGQKGPLPPQVPMQTRAVSGGMVMAGGGLDVRVLFSPLSIRIVRQADGSTLLESASGPAQSGFAPAAFTYNVGTTWNTFYWGYRGYTGVDQPWDHARGAFVDQALPDRVVFRLDIDHPIRGEMSLVVGPFYDGAVRIATAVTPYIEPVNRVALTFRAPADEHYVGFGERFNGVDQRGRVVQSWLEEGSIELGWLRPLFPNLEPEYAFPGGVTTSYAPIPFFISNEGYGLLADVPEPSHFDLAATQADAWRVQVEGSELSVIVFDGPSPADVLRHYTDRTGRSLVPRPWMLAPWNQMSNYAQGSSMAVARLFRQLDIPSSVHGGALHFLPAGSERGNEAAIAAQNAQYHALGYKSWCYFNPRVDVEKYTPLWDEGAMNGYFYKAADGKPYMLDVFGSEWFKVSEVDFTNPTAVTWYQNLLAKAIGLGFDGWMYDFAEYVPPDARFSDGHDGQYWHNPYALIYERTNSEYFRTLDDDPNDELAPDYVFYHRSGYAGSQAWSWAMWGGDASCSWSVADGLPAAVAGGVNVGLSGLPYWGSDIGGYHNILVPPTDAELLARWFEFGAFSGLMRDQTGGLVSSGPRTQILDDPALTAIVRRYQKLRTQLVPYLQNAAREAHQSGLPIMRAPLLHYGSDPAVWDVKREFLCGRDLYVAPVVEQGATTRSFYLPGGKWVDIWSRTEYDEATGGFRVGGDVVTGGRTVTVDAPLEECPLFVRYGAIIPLVDPSVDTFAPTDPSVDMVVTTDVHRAHLLHAWVFPDPAAIVASTRLHDGSELEVTMNAPGLHATRIAAPDGKELWLQILWPQGLAPRTVPGLTFVAGADPLTLAPGTWTWSGTRGSVALHAPAGMMQVDVLR